ncbi:hypothetical protein ETD86_34450 [Nonomuraea turkmeniaca]|uniref:Sensor histidine kinase n=1 Tax=Nonomuraea turkmeniaca TaxID=103838 RepID=A0A5S4F6M7_9ACTN|nr:hypothetical protein [Nonomuraea turkmeniaca]TMR11852.1 hypothetical protein ETD86_34450 [Nonomuraea turkmeniaca]
MMDIPLRLLRWTVHATALGLLVLAVLREERATVAVGGVLLGLLYAAGFAIEGKRVWLGLVTAGWVVLAVAAPPFVWLAFPLLFSYLHALPLWAAMFGVGALTSAAVLVAAWHAGELTMPLVLGPGVAAVVVTLLAMACRALQAERPPE